MRTSLYVSIPLLFTITSCISGGLEQGEYDYNYDSPAAAGAEIPPEPEEAPPIVEVEPAVVHLRAGETLYSLSVQHLGTGRRGPRGGWYGEAVARPAQHAEADDDGDVQRGPE